MSILAVEWSTASAKAMLYDKERGVLAVESVSFDPHICDTASQDADGCFKALTRCVLAIRGGLTDEVEAVGICATWHSLLLLDRERRPVDRIYTWANGSASQTVAKYRRDADFCAAYYQRTGCMVNSTYPFWQYMHIRDTRPEVAERAAYFSCQGQFLFERLTGEVAASTCTTAGSGFLNINDISWDTESIEFCGAGIEKFAPLKEATHRAPLRDDIAGRWGLKPGIPVVLGGADGALNQLGAGALGAGVMTFSVGTSGALRLASPAVVLPKEPATWCYYLLGGQRIVGGGTSGAGNCLVWFAEKMSLNGRLSFQTLDHAAAGVNREQAPIFLPFICGERCPGWKDDRLAGFRGISAQHNLSDLYYAVLEGVLFGLYHCYSILVELMPKPEKVLVSGGITRSNLWLQMAADIFSKELCVSNVEHVSLLGAVGLVRKALDPAYDLARRPYTSGTPIGPNAETGKLFARRFERYMGYYEQG